jgi:hypothetical protein
MTELRALTGSEIVERVRVRNADNLHLGGAAYWRSVVAAVLDAIAEPSPAMVEAAAQCWMSEGGGMEIAPSQMWRAMVDARKSEIAP